MTLLPQVRAVIYRWSFVRVLSALIALTLCSAGGASVSAQGPTIGGYVKVSERVGDGGNYVYVYRATLTNTGPSLSSATATVASLSPTMGIVDASLSFGAVAAGGTVVSTDTFSFRQKQSVAFDPTQLNWTINATAGPPPNAAPVVNAGPDATITLPAGASLNGTATDDGLPAGSALAVLWTQVSGPVTTTFAAASSASTTATFSKDGVYVLRLTADDGQKSASDTVTITVKPAINQAPVVDAGPDATIALPAGATLNGTATDDGLPAGSTLTFLWRQVSDQGTTTFAAASSASTTATFSKAGRYTLRLTVSDGQKSASDTVFITVQPQGTNLAPLVNAGADLSTTFPTGVTINGSASDDGLPAGATLSISWSQVNGPGTTTFGSPTTASTSASFSQPGTYTLRITASDSQKSTSDDVVVVVDPPTNVAPTVNAGADQTATFPATVTLNGTASDDGLPAGSTLSMAWSQASGPGTTTFGSPALATTTASFSQPGTYTLRLTASDSQKTTSDDVVVVIDPPTNVAPTVNAGADQTATLPAGVTLNGAASDDGLPAGSTLSMAWSQVSGPGTTTFGSPALATTTASFSQPGTYTLRLTASDSQKTTSDDVVVIVDTTNNVAPTVNAGSDQTLTYPAGTTLNGVVNDDGLPSGVLTSLWTQTSGAGTATFTAASSAVTGVSFSQPGSYVLRLTADDSAKQTFDELTITVNPPTNLAPVVNAGADQAVTYPSGANLTGTVSDDGLPSGSLTSLWTQTSGTGTATFAPATAASTSVSFSQPGSYVLRLTADDSDKQTFDEVTIAVNSPTNLAPMVNAGPDQSVTLPAAATLAGSSTDDGLPNNTLTFAWRKVDGPGDVTFNPPNAGSSAATFSAAGTYTLELQVSDGVLASVDTLTVIAAPSTTQNIAPSANAGPDQSVTLPVAATLAGSATDDGLPSNTLTFAWRKVDGPGDVTFNPPNASSSAATFSTAGTYTLELQVSDGALASADTLTVVAAPPTAQNIAPSVNAGTDQEVTFELGASLTGIASDDGKPTAPLQLSWQKGSGLGQVTFDSQNGASTKAFFTQPGTYVLTLTASDGEFATTDDIAVTVADPLVQGDRAPPTVTLAAPKEALPGATVELRAQAYDDVAVAAVRFEVDGQQPVETAQQPYLSQFTVPQLASPGTLIHVKAIARDTSNNTADADAIVSISVVPDTQSPTVQLLGPLNTAPGRAVRFVAKALDNVGVRSVTFFVDGVEVRLDRDSPFEASYLVPASSPVGTPLAVLARATDFAGNIAESPLSVEVVSTATADTTPPQIELTAPGQAFPGSTVALSATASDAGGVASVTFLAGPVPLATVLETPYEASYTISALQSPGTTVQVAAEATDFATLTATAAKTIQIVAPTALTEAAVGGEVYDDTTSLPLGGAAIALVGTDGSGQTYTQTTISDSRGRYLILANAGSGVVEIRKAGWTRVDRPVALIGGQAIDAFDARLTPLRDPAQTISPVIGGTLGVEAKLILPPGALAQSTALQIARISQQGLHALLPFGWSPVGGADIVPHGETLIGQATLRLPNSFGLNATRPIAVVWWNESTRAWRVVGDARLGQGNTIEADVATTGQFAFVVADEQPQAPPAAAIGQALQGVPQPALPLSLTTEISPQPQILFYRPGAFSDVHGQVTASAPLTSGSRFLARVSESYLFNSSAEARPEPFVEDLVFFQSSSAPATVGTNIAVTPSLDFDPLLLERGVISVEVFAADASSTPTALVGPSGGRIDGPNGASLFIPVGAITTASPMSLSAITSSELGPLPAGLSFVQGVQFFASSALARGANLTVPLPAGVTTADDLLLVRLADIQGATRLVLAGVVRIDNGRLVADTLVNGQQTALAGVREIGRYAFVRASSALGFAGGLVRGVNTAPFAGALVTAAGFGVVSLSNPAGAYLAAAPIGSTALTATDLIKADVGTATGFLTVATVVPVTLQLIALPPRVLTVAPAPNSQSAPLTGAVVITFSEAIDPGSVAGANLANVLLADTTGAPLLGSASLSQSNTVLTFRPSQELLPNARYTLTIATGIQDTSGYGLTAPYVSTFDTLDTSPPPQPAAGALSASVPNPQGLVTVSGTQGTAGPNDRVFVDNLTRKTVAVALVDPNGSFSTAILAGITDKLRVRIIDASGNETIQAIGAFKQTNADGSISQAVTADGGVIDGPAGLQAAVKPGTFPEGAVVTLKPVALADLPPMTPAEAANFPMVNGIELDFGGVEPLKYVDVSFPATANDTVDDQWILAQVATVNGQQVLNVADTAKYRNGRIVTSSPPCPGVLAAAVYGLMKAAQTYGLNFADMYANGRYKLEAQPAVFTSSPIPIPYTVLNPVLPMKVCFPIITGRVSIGKNSTRLRIAPDQLIPADTQIVVKNTTRFTTEVFPRLERDYAFTINVSQGQAVYLHAIGPALDDGTANDAIDDYTRSPGYDILKTGSAPVPTTFTIKAGAIAAPILGVQVKGLIYVIEDVFVPTEVFTVAVAGSPSDEYIVEAIPDLSLLGKPRVGPYLLRRVVTAVPAPSPYGPGSLVIRATPGTIDPSRAELDALNPPVVGDARKQVFLTNDQTGPRAVNFEIPEAKIVLGGFDYAFDGPEDAKYTLTITYEHRNPFSVDLPNFRIVVKNVNTGEILKTLFGQSPPRDEPQALEPITDDHESPVIVSGPTQVSNFDPSGLIAFRFSEGMNADSLKKAFVVIDQATGKVVQGTVRVSDGNTLATFVPSQPLRLGVVYEIRVLGADSATGSSPGQTGFASDLAGNAFAKTVLLNVRTFSPRSLGVFNPNGPPVVFKDVALEKREVDPIDEFYAYAITGGISGNFVSIDVTDPQRPTTVARIGTSQDFSRQRIALALNPTGTWSGGNGSKALAITSTFNVDEALVTYVTANDPRAPLELGTTRLAKKEETTKFGYAKTVAVLQDQAALLAYVVVERVGVQAIDTKNAKLLNNYPQPGIKDIVAWNGSIIAVSQDGTAGELEVLDASLGAPTHKAALRHRPTRLRVADDIPLDLDSDGGISPSEHLAVAVIGGDQAVTLVKLADRTGHMSDPLEVVGNDIRINGVVRDLEVDAPRARVLAAVDEPTGTYLYVIDLHNITLYSDLDSDGRDDRIIFRKAYAPGVNGMRIDNDRALLYLATPGGLDIWLIGDNCCDLGIEMTANLEKKGGSKGATGSKADALKAELDAIKAGTVEGLKRAEAKCPGFNVADLKLIESGSSACLWSKNPAKACGSNYQPLVSDHDISTFMPNSYYTGAKVKDPNDDDPDSPKPQVYLASCVASALSFPFTDPDTEEAKPVNGLLFKDISFLPNWVEDLTSLHYRLDRTIDGFTGDQDNDLAMGRQLLVLKHLTEAHGVDLTGAPGYKASYAAVNVTEQEFEDKFRIFRTVTKIPEFEGYEWSILMRFMLGKGKTALRIQGASDERSAFNALYVKQYHTAAKAGIRAALARMVAHTPARDMVLRIRRGDPGPNDPPEPGLLVFNRNACFTYRNDLKSTAADLAQWLPQPCGSMEEYVAASAVRSLFLPQAGQGPAIFTLQEVLDIQQFFRVKADIEPIFTESDADKFIAKAHRFLKKVTDETFPVYQQLVPLNQDGWMTQRLSNRDYAEGIADAATAPGTKPGGRLLEVLDTDAHLGVVPFVSNRGFRNALGLYLRAFHALPGQTAATDFCWSTDPNGSAQGSGPDVCKIKIDLQGGTKLYPRWVNKKTGEFVRDYVDGSKELYELHPKLFTDIGKTGFFTFSIDLPERSVPEANRENNIGGFHYYILDPNAANPTPTFGALPKPISDPRELLPDPECLEQPSIEVTQTMLFDGDEHLSPVLMYLGAQGTLLIHVTNPGPSPIADVQVSSSLAPGQHFSAGTVGGGRTEIVRVPFTSPIPVVKESVAVASAADVGVSNASLLRVSVDCAPMIVPLSPDPNIFGEFGGQLQPSSGTAFVMAGGKAVRHYLAKNPFSGAPAQGVEVSFSVDNGSTLKVKSNQLGLLGDEVAGRFLPGVKVLAANASDTLTVTANTVGGVALGSSQTCGEPVTFKVRGQIFRYNQSIEAGSAIRAGFKLFDQQASASFGGSVKAVFSNVRSAQPAAGAANVSQPAEIDGLGWERQAKIGLKGGFSFPGFSAKSEFNGSGGLVANVSASGLSFKANAEGAATQTYRYQFPRPREWDAPTAKAFVTLLFPAVAESDAQSFRALKGILPDELVDPILRSEDSYRPYRKGRIGAISIQGTANATGFDGTIDFKKKEAKDANGADKNPSGAGNKENKSKPAFSAGSSGNATLALGYEKAEGLDTTQGPDDIVTDLVHTFVVDGQYDWKSNTDASVDKYQKAIDDDQRLGQIPGSAAIKQKAKDLLKWTADQVTFAAKGSFDGGVVFKVHSKVNQVQGQAPEYHIRKLEVSFRSFKNYGLIGATTGDPKANTKAGATGDQDWLTFVLEGEEAAQLAFTKIVEKQPAFFQLLSQAQQDRMNAFLAGLGQGHLPPEASLFDPQKVYDQFIGFVASLFSASTGTGELDNNVAIFPKGVPVGDGKAYFYETRKRGTFEEYSFGINQSKLEAFTIDPFRVDEVSEYYRTKGVIADGSAYVLEDYTALNIEPPDPRALFEQTLEDALNEVLHGLGTFMRRQVQKIEGPAGSSSEVKNPTASLKTPTSGDMTKTDLGWWQYKGKANSGPEPYFANASSGPDDKPHYGLGGFHSFYSELGPWSQPSELTLSYADTEVVGFPENTIRMFRWSNARRDWDLIPAALDVTDNTVTALVSEMGLYTLGAIMPTGELHWTVISFNQSGSGTSASTSAILESEVIQLNDGSPAPEGTLIHVLVPHPDLVDANDVPLQFGTFSTPDADPLPGMQMAVGANGKVRFEVTVPVATSQLPLIAFSDRGTANSSGVVRLQ